MTQNELKQTVRGALASLEAVREHREESLLELEVQLAELLTSQLPGSDRETILLLIRECVGEARAGG